MDILNIQTNTPPAGLDIFLAGWSGVISSDHESGTLTIFHNYQEAMATELRRGVEEFLAHTKEHIVHIIHETTLHERILALLRGEDGLVDIECQYTNSTGGYVYLVLSAVRSEDVLEYILRQLIPVRNSLVTTSSASVGGLTVLTITPK